MEKKKILIIDLGYLALANANAVCLNRILPFLDSYDITIMAEAREEEHNEIPSFCKIVRTEVYQKNQFHKLPLKDYLFMQFQRVRKLLTHKAIDYKKVADFLISTKNYDFSQFDAVLSICYSAANVPCAYAISKKYNIPWIAYYLDPFSTNIIKLNNLSNRIINYERQLLTHASQIILTHPIDLDYKKNNVISAAQKNISVVNLPGVHKITPNDNTPTIFDSKHINCLFIGNLYWVVRNPLKTIELFTKLGSDYKLYFIGKSFKTREKMEEMGLLNNDNVVFLDPVSNDTAEQYMLQADLLINIGNDYSNQIPSKIFDYISSCKPVLNIYKIDDCPSLELFSNYPLVINVKESELENEYTRVKEGIESIIHKTAKYEDIIGVYKTYSSEYVASIIKQVLDAHFHQ